LALRYGVFLIATVLVNPHGYVYDVVILMPAYLMLWNTTDGGNLELGMRNEESRTQSPSFLIPNSKFRISCLVLLYLCYWSPDFAIVAMKWHVQLSVIALTILLGTIVRSSAAPAPPVPAGAGREPFSPISGCRSAARWPRWLPSPSG